MSDININKLKLYLIKPDQLEKSIYYELMLNFYHRWQEVWKTSYEKLGADPEKILKLYSDKLLLNDEVVILTYEDEIVSGASFKIFDISNELQRHQEYFSEIDDLTMHKLKKVSNNGKIFSCGDLTLVSKFCTRNAKFNWKYLMLAILFERSIRQDNGPLVAYTNNTMKVTKGCTDLGAEILQKEFIHHLPFGAECVVDIIFVNIQTMQKADIEMSFFTDIAQELVDSCQSNSSIGINKKKQLSIA